jgi:deoxycytidine triphosphate deaminase
MAMESPPEIAYGEKGKGNYQGQTGATRARSDELFKKVTSLKE